MLCFESCSPQVNRPLLPLTHQRLLGSDNRIFYFKSWQLQKEHAMPTPLYRLYTDAQVCRVRREKLQEHRICKFDLWPVDHTLVHYMFLPLKPICLASHTTPAQGLPWAMSCMIRSSHFANSTTLALEKIASSEPFVS